MADYTKVTDFSAWDISPYTVYSGSLLGAEYDAIAVAVATKVNKIIGGTENDILMQDSNGDTITSGLNPTALGKILSLQKYTSGGTWTKPTGCNRVIVYAVGAGGNGGGAAAGLDYGAGSGGSAGASGMVVIDYPIPTSVAYTVAAGGTTAKTAFGPYISCESGANGLRATAGATGTVAAGGRTNIATASGVSSYVLYNGQSGDEGFRFASGSPPAMEYLESSKGGSTVLFPVKSPLTRIASASSNGRHGRTPDAPGSGGTGAVKAGGAGNPYAGGTGANGLLVVISFS